MKTAFYLFCMAVCVCFVGCVKQRTPSAYEIPEGFVGWVTIDYGQSDAPALPLKDDRRIFLISPDGHLATSSRILYGMSVNTYEYIGNPHRVLPQTIWGGGGMIWAGEIVGPVPNGDESRVQERFFVGTEAEYKKSIGRED